MKGKSTGHLPCPNCSTSLLDRRSKFDEKQVRLILKAIKAGRQLLIHLDQAQLFWKHEETAELHQALETGDVFAGAELAILATIKERLWYYLTDRVPAYEPILRQGSTRKHPFVDPTLEHARLLWEGIYTFERSRRSAEDYRRSIRVALQDE